MWSCDLNADPPVVIGIHYKNTQQSKELSLAKIKIWNYNHNLKVCIHSFIYLKKKEKKKLLLK